MYVVWNRTTGEYQLVPDGYKAQSLAQGLNSQGNGTWSIKKESEIKADPTHKLYHSLHDDPTNLTPESQDVEIQAQTPYLGEEPTHLRTPDYLQQPEFNPRPVQHEMPPSSSPGYDKDYHAGLRQQIVDRQDSLLANQGLPPQSEQLGVVPASPGRLAADYAAPFDQTQGIPTVTATDLPSVQPVDIPVELDPPVKHVDIREKSPLDNAKSKVRQSLGVWEPDVLNQFPETPNYRVDNIVRDGAGGKVRAGDGYLRSRTDEEIMMDEQDPFWWMR